MSRGPRSPKNRPGDGGTVMNTSTDQTGLAASKLGGVDDSLFDLAERHFRGASVVAHNEGQPTARSKETLFGLRALGNPPSLRMAIKVRGKILFIDLNDVVAIHSKGNYLCIEQRVGSLLIRGSISVAAETLDGHGFIRINRSALVNAWFVEEISPLPTGEYCLRIKGGREYSVSRTYKRNLKSLAKFWIGSGVFFPDRAG